jgi:hypothetical protein
MTNIDRTLKRIRPRLRDVAPQTFWFSIGFGVFNAVVGLALYNISILYTLRLVGVIPLKAWGFIFMLHGIFLLGSLIVNNWSFTRSLHFFGVALKSAWWLELLAVTISGRSPFLLYVWSLLLFLQIIVCIFFTPRVNRDQQ